jgi:Antitoxin VbhA
MTTPTREELDRNMQNVAHAIAQQELEGLNVPEATVKDLHWVARGEIDTEEALRNVKRRLKNGQVLER